MVFLCVAIAPPGDSSLSPCVTVCRKEDGKRLGADPILLLGLIGLLMAVDGLFDATATALSAGRGVMTAGPPLSLTWIFEKALIAAPLPLA